MGLKMLPDNDNFNAKLHKIKMANLIQL